MSALRIKGAINLTKTLSLIKPKHLFIYSLIKVLSSVMFFSDALTQYNFYNNSFRENVEDKKSQNRLKNVLRIYLRLNPAMFKCNLELTLSSRDE